MVSGQCSIYGDLTDKYSDSSNDDKSGWNVPRDTGKEGGAGQGHHPCWGGGHHQCWSQPWSVDWV